jgi:plastocyanin
MTATFRWLRSPVVAMAGMLLVGCGAGGAVDASPVATSQVDMPPSYRFSPVAILVETGATVTWTNADNFTHSVLFDGDSEPIAMLEPGERATHTFESTGRFPYVCSLHPQDMTGVVEVVAP